MIDILHKVTWGRNGLVLTTYSEDEDCEGGVCKVVEVFEEVEQADDDLQRLQALVPMLYSIAEHYTPGMREHQLSIEIRPGRKYEGGDVCCCGHHMRFHSDDGWCTQGACQCMEYVEEVENGSECGDYDGGSDCSGCGDACECGAPEPLHVTS